MIVSLQGQEINDASGMCWPTWNPQLTGHIEGVFAVPRIMNIQCGTTVHVSDVRSRYAGEAVVIEVAITQENPGVATSVYRFLGLEKST